MIVMQLSWFVIKFCIGSDIFCKRKKNGVCL